MKPYSDTVQRTARKGVGSAKKKKAAVQKGIAKVSCGGMLEPVTYTVYHPVV